MSKVSYPRPRTRPRPHPHSRPHPHPNPYNKSRFLISDFWSVFENELPLIISLRYRSILIWDFDLRELSKLWKFVMLWDVWNRSFWSFWHEAFKTGYSLRFATSWIVLGRPVNLNRAIPPIFRTLLHHRLHVFTFHFVEWNWFDRTQYNIPSVVGNQTIIRSKQNSNRTNENSRRY